MSNASTVVLEGVMMASMNNINSSIEKLANQSSASINVNPNSIEIIGILKENVRK
jgi:hypothetical protein